MGNYCSCNELESTTELKLCHSYEPKFNNLQNLSLDFESDSLPYLEYPSSVSNSSFSPSNNIQELSTTHLPTMKTLKLSKILIKKPEFYIEKRN